VEHQLNALHAEGLITSDDLRAAKYDCALACQQQPPQDGRAGGQSMTRMRSRRGTPESSMNCSTSTAANDSATSVKRRARHSSAVAANTEDTGPGGGSYVRPRSTRVDSLDDDAALKAKARALSQLLHDAGREALPEPVLALKPPRIQQYAAGPSRRAKDAAAALYMRKREAEAVVGRLIGEERGEAELQPMGEGREGDEGGEEMQRACEAEIANRDECLTALDSGPRRDPRRHLSLHGDCLRVFLYSWQQQRSSAVRDEAHATLKGASRQY